MIPVSRLDFLFSSFGSHRSQTLQTWSCVTSDLGLGNVRALCHVDSSSRLTTVRPFDFDQPSVNQRADTVCYRPWHSIIQCGHFELVSMCVSIYCTQCSFVRRLSTGTHHGIMHAWHRMRQKAEDCTEGCYLLNGRFFLSNAMHTLWM